MKIILVVFTIVNTIMIVGDQFFNTMTIGLGNIENSAQRLLQQKASWLLLMYIMHYVYYNKQSTASLQMWATSNCNSIWYENHSI